MKVVRSWPASIPPHRNYVVDNLPKFIMSRYDYRGLGQLGDDVLLIEWDMALGKEDLDALIGLARDDLSRVLICPYRVYQQTSSPEMLPHPVWVHRLYNVGEQSMRHVVEGDSGAHLWGLGVAYLPRDVLRQFEASWPGDFNDATLSGWHNRNVEPEAQLTWDIRPVHLHYPIERILT